MHVLVISKVAHQLLAAEANSVLVGAVALPDGRWQIEVDDTVFEHLERQAPYDASDAVIRACEGN